MSSPLVSIVICEYNTDLKMLNECLESIFRQTYKNFELIFINDFSSTNLKSLSLRVKPNVKIINNKRNLGVAASRNIGIENSSGKYIAFMDTDDISEPKRIERQVQFLESNNDVVACGTWFKQFGKKNNAVKRVIDDNEYYRCCLLFGNVPTILNPSVMIRKSALVENDILYDSRLRYGEDYDMWIKLSDIGRVTNVKEILMNYRVRDGQLSQQLKKIDYLNEYLWIIYKKQLTAVGVELEKYNESFLRTNYKVKTIDALKYYRFLQDILKCNTVTRRYNQIILSYRVKEQFVNKIFSIKNPLKLLKLFVFLPCKDKKLLLKAEFSRLNRKRIRNIHESEIVEFKPNLD